MKKFERQSPDDEINWLRKEVAAALADPAPSIPVEKVFSDLRAYHERLSRQSRTQRPE